MDVKHILVRKQIIPALINDIYCKVLTIELIQRKVAGGGDGVREYLVLEYAPSKRGQPADRLFVPMDQLDQVRRHGAARQQLAHHALDLVEIQPRKPGLLGLSIGQLVPAHAASDPTASTPPGRLEHGPTHDAEAEVHR